MALGADHSGGRSIRGGPFFVPDCGPRRAVRSQTTDHSGLTRVGRGLTFLVYELLSKTDPFCNPAACSFVLVVPGF